MDPATKAQIQEVFNEIDKDKSGFLSREEMKVALQKMFDDIDLKMTDADIQKMLDEADKNKDGKISIEEFIQMIQKQQNKCSEQLNQYKHFF